MRRVFLARPLAAVAGAALLLSPSLRAADPQPYTRITQLKPRVFRLEVGWRTFHAPGKPDVLLAGMVHNGSPDFFVHVLGLLKDQPFVLIEDANTDVPERPAATASESEKKKWTQAALLTVGQLVGGYYVEYKTLPDSLDSVLFALERDSAWAFDLRNCMTDAWGQPVAYRRTGTGYELTSNGSMAAPDPALTITHTDRWVWTNLSEDRVKNTDELGLLEQTNGGLTYDHANFHFCDMLVSEYRRRVKALPQARTSPDFTTMDAPNAFDDGKYPHDLQLRRFLILEAAGTPHIRETLHPEGEDHVALIERNDVVWGEIGRRMSAEKPVCVLYGAAHLYDLEQRLVTQEGYTPGGTQWLTVFDADLTNSRITDGEIAEIEADAKAGRMGYY